MAREILITRTIKTRWATVMCIDTNTNEVVNKEIIIPRIVDTNPKILAYAVGCFQENIVPAKVVKVEETEALYGMTEEEFVRNAQVLPPRKVYSTGNKGEE